MITKRPVDSALETFLEANSPYRYAHLVKFERPSKLNSTLDRVSTSAKRYTYLTDGSVNVSFDDGSLDRDGNPNGTQTYIANKLVKVGSIQEQTKATASQTSISLIGNALGAFISSTNATIATASGLPANLTGYTITFTSVTVDDLIAQGFREGDKVNIKVNSINYPVNIYKFQSTNVMLVTKIDVSLPALTGNIEVSLASEEIISILLNKDANDYASFINREVFIYRAYFNDSGSIVGSPILMFKGIIYNVGFEDNENEIKVTWGLTSHWGDFAQVKGRITSDAFHRALDENGRPDPQSALRNIYAYDKGFNHAETSVNTIAHYTTMVDKVDSKFKKGFLGIGAKSKVTTYQVAEDRQTRLDFQLQGKSIPLVYGVRKIEGNLIFADTLLNNSAEVYVAQVLCEGEIGGLYDAYIESNSLVCANQEDYEARASGVTRSTEASDSIQLTCSGRADRGDVLNGAPAVSNVWENYFTGYDIDSLYYGGGYPLAFNFQQYIPPETVAYTPSGAGLVDGDSIHLTSPQTIDLDIFSGKPGQAASAQLVTTAANKNFKIQNSYWTGKDTYEYWGPNHRLIDTAYIVGHVTIKEGETSLPEVTYVVRGKVIDCYNYDYSYVHDRKLDSEYGSATAENPDLFPLGAIVSLYNPDTPAVAINSGVQIIDKWSYYNPDGKKQWRFRFGDATTGAPIVPNLDYDDEGVPSITKFYMQSGANTWTMLTYNHDLVNDNVGATIEADITGSSNINNNFAISYSNPSAYMTIEGDPGNDSPSFRIVSSTRGRIPGADIANSIMVGTISSNTLTTKYPHSLLSDQTIPTGAKLASVNTIKLPSTANETDDYYVGYMIEISLYDTETGKTYTQEEVIIGYNGANRVATIGGMWEEIPTTSYKVRVYQNWADGRVSINPVMQTLDYISSKTYGKGLEVEKDIDLPSWCESARICDTQSKVTVRRTSSTAAVTGLYKWLNTAGQILWQGYVDSTDDVYVTFTNVIGKLTNKWNSWKDWKEGELVYNSEDGNKLYKVTNVIAANPTNPANRMAPTHTSGEAGGFTYQSSITLSGPTPITLVGGSNNPVQYRSTAGIISGYSLYDADSIDYWRFCGWDDHLQRFATKFQTNIQIDTSQPLFDNINALLEHYNGILRYTAGKYYMDIEQLEGDIAPSDIRFLTEDDIVGKIQLSDEGNRSSYNSLTASFADPANKYEARNISFFNSDYLKADRNVPKKGNLTVPGVTNYYNTRLLAESTLNRSRYGLSVNLTVRPIGVLLMAGTVIEIYYPRYGSEWASIVNNVKVGKKFRIESVTYQPDGLTDIVAKEYNDSFYNRTHIGAAPVTGLNSAPAPVRVVGNSPTALTASIDRYNQIALSWNPGTTASASSYTEVWRADVNDIEQASIIAVIPVAPGTTNTYVDMIPPNFAEDPSAARYYYYWVRRRMVT